MKRILSNRWILYCCILLSGFFIAVAFIAFNTSYQFLFWPVLIFFGIIFVISVNKVMVIP
ncbi:MAG: hypothetical protein Q8R37_02055 [Nanoarchaeota archaeon]|nr:hypothetical protein [Nanoarchaeota archaeon]